MPPLIKPIVLFLTDSVALPRQTDEGPIHWNEIYIHRLRGAFQEYEIVNCSIGGGSIKDIRNQLNYYRILNPKIVVLHCGIVDAAPRAFGRLEMEIIKKLRLFRLTKPFVRPLRKYRQHHYTDIRTFRALVSEIRQELCAERFLGIGILPASEGYENILPGISKATALYNAALQDLTEFVNIEDIPPEFILPDFHHINAKGHEYLFTILTQMLKASETL